MKKCNFCNGSGKYVASTARDGTRYFENCKKCHGKGVK